MSTLLDQVNTEGVYAAMAKTERKKLTSSIFRKWKARGGLMSPGVQYLDPTKGAIKGNIRWVSLACQIVYCAEYDGVSWAPRDANHPRVAERNSSTDSVTQNAGLGDRPHQRGDRARHGPRMAPEGGHPPFHFQESDAGRIPGQAPEGVGLLIASARKPMKNDEIDLDREIIRPKPWS